MKWIFNSLSKQSADRKRNCGVYRLFEIYSWLEDGKATKARIRYFVKIEVDKQILRRIHRGIAD